MVSLTSISRLYAQTLGVFLLVLGVLGWIPSLSSSGRFLGLFGLTPVDNLAHLFLGLVGLVAGLLLSDASVRLYALSLAVIFGLLAFIGYVHLGVLALNQPDTLLQTAIFVLSLLVSLAAFNEQGFGARLAQTSAAASPRVRQQATSPAHSGHTWKRRALDPVAVAVEQLRWQLENDEHAVESLERRQQMLEHELVRMRSDLDLLRAWQQAPQVPQVPQVPQAPQPQRPQGARPSWASRPTAAPRRGEASPWAWPNETSN
jgi:hypothetical protein